MTATRSQTAKVRQPVVNVREEPNGDPTGDYLSAGDQVQIVECSEFWCQISKPVKGYVWRGCLDSTINIDGLGCRAR